MRPTAACNTSSYVNPLPVVSSITGATALSRRCARTAPARRCALPELLTDLAHDPTLELGERAVVVVERHQLRTAATCCSCASTSTFS